jgi:DNA polymerase-1
MDESMESAKEKGFVETLFHRRRYLPEIKSANIGLRQFAQRQAINAPLQGTAADIIKIAMVKVDRAMQAEKLDSTMIMTVHDELVFDVPYQETDVLVKILKEHMENVVSLDVPLKAGLKTGPNWMQMSSIS